MDIPALFNVQNKTVLVTGGSRGIGKMIAEGYAANGAKVYITARSASVCDETAKELSAKYKGQVISIPADLAKLDEVKRLVGEISKNEDKLHILVNNAGANWSAPIDEYPDKAFDKVMDLNTKRVFTLTQACLPLMRRAASQDDPARVIQIGSIDGLRVPSHPTYAYSASKAALHHMSRHLAIHMADDFITVNTLACGAFESKMMAQTLKDFGDMIKSGNPLKRIGTPQDVAGACLFLSSRAGAYVTGALISVSGGQELAANL